MTQRYPVTRMLRKPAVLARLGFSKSTLYARINGGLLPPPIPLGGRAVGFIECEIDTVLAAMVAGKSKEEIQAIVSNLIAQRQFAA